MRSSSIFISILTKAVILLTPFLSYAAGQPTFSLMLVDATSGKEIGEVQNGQTLVLSELPSRKLTLVAVAGPEINAVVFDLNEHKRIRYETGRPFTLLGDSNGRFNPWVPKEGPVVVTATPFLGKELKPGTPLVISLDIVEKRDGSGSRAKPDLKALTPPSVPKTSTELTETSQSTALPTVPSLNSTTPEPSSRNAAIPTISGFVSFINPTPTKQEVPLVVGFSAPVSLPTAVPSRVATVLPTNSPSQSPTPSSSQSPTVAQSPTVQVRPTLVVSPTLITVPTQTSAITQSQSAAATAQPSPTNGFKPGVNVPAQQTHATSVHATPPLKAVLPLQSPLPAPAAPSAQIDEKLENADPLEVRKYSLFLSSPKLKVADCAWSFDSKKSMLGYNCEHYLKNVGEVRLRLPSFEASVICHAKAKAQQLSGECLLTKPVREKFNKHFIYMEVRSVVTKTIIAEGRFFASLNKQSSL